MSDLQELDFLLMDTCQQQNHQFLFPRIFFKTILLYILA